MSTAGQAVGGVIGAVAGFFTPIGPMYGAQIGMMVGGYLDPVKNPDVSGPRLDDLTVQTSTYGADIPRIYSTAAVTGNVFWLENNRLKETATSTTSGGKGAGSKTTTTTYSYSATFAVGLCHCPKDPIIGVKRIWIGGRLWYDAGTTDMAAMIASNSAQQYFTLHTGAEDQAPDDRMQATLGVANTPAYRGLAYIVFKDLPLAEYSNTLMGAQVKVEVVATGHIEPWYTTSGTLPAAGNWHNIACNGRIFCAIGTGKVALSADGLTWTLPSFPSSAEHYAIASDGSNFVALTYGAASGYISSDGVTWIAITLPVSGYWRDVCWTGKYYYAAGWSSSNFITSEDGKLWTLRTLPISGGWVGVAATSATICIISQGGDVLTSPDNGASWIKSTLQTSSYWAAVRTNGDQFVALSGYTQLSVSSDGVDWTSLSIPSTGNWRDVRWNGELWLAVGMNGVGQGACVYSPDAVNWTVLPLPLGQWYPLCWNGAVWCSVGNSESKAVTIRQNVLTTSDYTLSAIVSAEVEQSQLLTASDIDVSGLTQTVRGYRISSVSSIRSGIEPLRGAWPFDVIQHGYKVLFKPRGSESVVTIPASDLDARGSGDSAGVSITAVREMDSQLPRRVRVSFMDFDREYETNEQSDERQNTASVNITSLDLAVVLTCAEAAGIAQVLLYLYWLERYDITFSLPPTYAALEPSDVITVQADEANYVLRLTTITYTQDGRLECTAKFHSSATYTPTATGVSGSTSAQTLSGVGNSQLILLDVPLLVDSYDKPGFIAAMTGYQTNWPGGVIQKSDDYGQTWTTLQAITAPGSVIGIAANAIGAGRTDIFDSASVLTVYLTQGELSSVTELAVLNGTNWFAYGTHGRWEIIAARTCTLQSDGSYLLTDLLRGRKGTEWACASHAIGDVVVALDSSTVDFVGMSLDSIGAERYYKGVTIGLSADAVPSRSFTYSGVNLECLSPVYLNGNRHPTTNDWTLTWVRRTRIGGQWRDYVDATIGETAEAYEIDIYATSAYSTVKRTLTASAATVAYTSAQQVTDFGSNQATLYVKVYQISANVGRGYPLTTSITR